MKVIHCISIASLLLAIGLLVTGFPKVAALVFGVAILIELLASALLGKQTNDGNQ